MHEHAIRSHLVSCAQVIRVVTSALVTEPRARTHFLGVRLLPGENSRFSASPFLP